MNRDQRAKATALMAVHFGGPRGDDERCFVRGLDFLASQEEQRPLSWRQRFFLDVLVWRYRAQLAGQPHLGFELPREAPRECEYEPHDGRPVQGGFW